MHVRIKSIYKRPFRSRKLLVSLYVFIHFETTHQGLKSKRSPFKPIAKLSMYILLSKVWLNQQSTQLPIVSEMYFHISVHCSCQQYTQYHNHWYVKHIRIGERSNVLRIEMQRTYWKINQSARWARNHYFSLLFMSSARNTNLHYFSWKKTTNFHYFSWIPREHTTFHYFSWWPHKNSTHYHSSVLRKSVDNLEK